MKKYLKLCLIISITISISGCMSPEFQALDPSKSSEYDARILGKEQSNMWYWVRGKINGDVDGDKDSSGNKILEEILLVSQQSGTRGTTGPMDEAYVIVCKRDPNTGFRDVLCRKTIYSSYKNITDAQFPKTTLGKWQDNKFEKGNLQLIDIDGDTQKEILVSLWFKTGDGVSAQHYCLKYFNKNLHEMLAVKALQNSPTITSIDINKDGKEELVVPYVLDNTLSAGKDPVTEKLMPEWACIYSHTGKGTLQQSNAAFPDYYTDIQLKIYEDMSLRAENLPQDILGIHQLYLGLIYTYKGNEALGNMFLRRAAINLNDVGRMAGKFLGRGGSTTNIPAPAKLEAPGEVEEPVKRPAAELRDGPEL